MVDGVIEQVSITIDEEPIPEWSGQFLELNFGVAIRRVHISDTRQHLAPPGWRAIAHDTFEDGSFETYIFFKALPE